MSGCRCRRQPASLRRTSSRRAATVPSMTSSPISTRMPPTDVRVHLDVEVDGPAVLRRECLRAAGRALGVAQGAGHAHRARRPHRGSPRRPSGTRVIARVERAVRSRASAWSTSVTVAGSARPPAARAAARSCRRRTATGSESALRSSALLLDGLGDAEQLVGEPGPRPLAGRADHGDDAEVLEGVGEVARRHPPAPDGVDQQVERRSADLAPEEAAHQAGLGLGRRRDVGDRPAQGRLRAEQRGQPKRSCPERSGLLEGACGRRRPARRGPAAPRPRTRAAS